jgi:UDP-N-acetylmuramoyl-L-alanyl-D-glutamate--2,6-diaminopimelate ligase
MWQKIKNIYHFFVAVFANIIFLFPSRGLTVIGVTGTDGKTTTASFIFHILKSSGKKAALVSSIGVEFENKKIALPFHVTTPSPVSLQWLILKAKLAGVKYLVLEVTSHSIDQYRIWGIPFKISVLTNVTNEHLDYHKTYDNYLKTKLKLLKRSNLAIVNEDDASYEHVKKYIGPDSKVYNIRLV